MSHALVLTAHVAVGVIGLVLGPIAIQAAVRRQHNLAAEAYDCHRLARHTAGPKLRFRSPPAQHRAELSPDLWLRPKAATATADFVVSAGGTPLLWVLPTAIGAPVVEWLTHRAAEAGAVRCSAAHPGT